MKKIALISFLSICFWVSAQVVNYKKLNVPQVDIKGQVFNSKGIKIGSLEENGDIKNLDSEKIAYIDAFGTLIEVNTDKRVGKCDINGNIYPIKLVKGGFKGWKLTMPEPGVEICLLRDDKKKLVAATHKHFKQYGGVAIYYLIKKQKK